MNKRRQISDKKRLQVLKRDRFACKMCGRNLASDPDLVLEVDHIVPVSKGGSDEISNLQSLCMYCNRGKGNDENLNKALEDDMANILDQINPLINEGLKLYGRTSVVANQEDFTRLVKLNDCCGYFVIKPTTNTIFGYQTGRSLGIYTLRDNSGAKVHFLIAYSR